MATNETFFDDICPQLTTAWIVTFSFAVFFFISTVILIIIVICLCKNKGSLCPINHGEYRLLDQEKENQEYEHDQQRTNRKESSDISSPLLSHQAEIGPPVVDIHSVHGTSEVQVYAPQGTGEDFVKDLVKRLSQQASIKMEFNVLSSNVEIKADQPMLVVCMNSTRLGTDAKTVVKNVQGHKRSSLVIFHHKDKQSLETEQPSLKILWGAEFDQFQGRIFDIGCWTGSGVYSCNMNTKSISDILEFCTKCVASCRQSEQRRSTSFNKNEKAKIQ